MKIVKSFEQIIRKSQFFYRNIFNTVFCKIFIFFDVESKCKIYNTFNEIYSLYGDLFTSRFFLIFMKLKYFTKNNLNLCSPYKYMTKIINIHFVIFSLIQRIKIIDNIFTFHQNYKVRFSKLVSDYSSYLRTIQEI